MIQPCSSYSCACVSSSDNVSVPQSQGTDFGLMIHDAYRAPSNSFASEDDAIYGDAGSAAPTDTNGGANGGDDEEEAPESDGGGEEEEEDSEDVSHPFKRVTSPDNRFRRMSNLSWSTHQCRWTYDSRGRGPHVLPTHLNPLQNHNNVRRI